MTITLAPETEEKLRETARREGRDVDALANALLAELLAWREREFEADIAAQEAWVAIREGRERPYEEYVADRAARFPSPLPRRTRHDPLRDHRLGSGRGRHRLDC